MPGCAYIRPRSWSLREEGGVCVRGQNVHAKAGLPLQWLQSISLTTIKNIFPYHLNHVITYSAHPGFPQSFLVWALQCLTAQANLLFRTSLPLQYCWLQQTLKHIVPAMVTYTRHSFGDRQTFHYPNWDVDRFIVWHGIAHMNRKTGTLSAQTDLP